MKFSTNHQIIVAATLFGLCTPAYSATWLLNEFDVFGTGSPVVFNDTFDDGDRFSPPTSSLVDYVGSNVGETGGYLTFDSGNGGIFMDLPPTGPDSNDVMRDAVFLNNPITDQLTSEQKVVGAFDPLLGQMRSGRGDTYGIFLSSFSGGAFLSVSKVLGTGPAVIFEDEAFNIIGTDVISGVSGDIVLDLALDHSTDLVTPRYSVDGGLSYIDYVDWDFNAGLVAVDYTPAFPGDFVAAGALGQTAVPLPAPVLLFCSALGALGCMRRKMQIEIESEPYRRPARIQKHA